MIYIVSLRVLDMVKKHIPLRGGAEESIKVTNLYVIRFFASVPLALNDKVDMDKKTYVTQRRSRRV